MTYTSVSIKETRNNLSELIDRVALAKEAFVVTKFGKPKALLISVENFVVDKNNKNNILKATAGLWIGRKKINIGRKKASSRYGKIFS
jgi:prevent-host-death family protein